MSTPGSETIIAIPSSARSNKKNATSPQGVDDFVDRIKTRHINHSDGNHV